MTVVPWCLWVETYAWSGSCYGLGGLCWLVLWGSRIQSVVYGGADPPPLVFLGAERTGCIRYLFQQISSHSWPGCSLSVHSVFSSTAKGPKFQCERLFHGDLMGTSWLIPSDFIGLKLAHPEDGAAEKVVLLSLRRQFFCCHYHRMMPRMIGDSGKTSISHGVIRA